MAGKRFESGPVHVGGVFGVREKVTVQSIKDVRTLGNYNQDTYHYSSTSAQDAAMTKYWTDTKAAADNGTDIYNAITNSCDDKVAGALAAGGLSMWQFVGVPRLSGELLQATGHKMAAKDLKPKEQ